jgi:hypothetical protein
VVLIFRHDSPYYTPLTPLVRSVVVGMLRVLLLIWVCFCYSDLLLLRCCCAVAPGFTKRIFGWEDNELERDRLQEMLDTTLLTLLWTHHGRSSIVTRAFMWTFDSLDEDHELERFYSSFPGFRSSKVVDDPLPLLNGDEKTRPLHH